MSLGEFKEYCKEFDANISATIRKNKFEIKCIKCGSSDVGVLYDGKVISMGSEYTGAWTSQDMSLVFKCINCGNALGIKES